MINEKLKKKKVKFLRVYEEERTEAQINFYKLLMNMGDSAKSNGIKCINSLP